MGVQTDSDAATVWGHGKPVLRLRMAMPPSSRQVLDRQLLSVLRTELRQQIAHATEVSNKSLVCPFLVSKNVAVDHTCSLIPEQEGSSSTLGALMTVGSNCI